MREFMFPNQKGFLGSRRTEHMHKAQTNHRVEYGMTWNIAALRKSIPVGVYPDPTTLHSVCLLQSYVLCESKANYKLCLRSKLDLLCNI